jgi:hypothetical protein
MTLANSVIIGSFRRINVCDLQRTTLNQVSYPKKSTVVYYTYVPRAACGDVLRISPILNYTFWTVDELKGARLAGNENSFVLTARVRRYFRELRLDRTFRINEKIRGGKYTRRQQTIDIYCSETSQTIEMKECIE